MFETMLRNLVPMMLIRVGSVPTADKRKFAELLNLLTGAYLDNRRADFHKLLDQCSFPDDWKTSIMGALWRENPSK